MTDIAAWARTNGVTLAEARQRFAQYAILCGVASVPLLRASLVFKGGNALDFVWQPNRSTLDLDFSLDMDTSGLDASTETLQALFTRGLRVTSARHGGAFAVNSVRQQPPGEDRTFTTYTARVGYGLPDQHQLLLRMGNGQPSPQVVPVEIGINEPIGSSTTIAIGEGFPPIRICTIEDIVAEKLRALLQQPLRNRQRRQDVLDIAVIARSNQGLDRESIARFLVEKARARDVPVTRSAFRNPEVATRAQADYAALEPTTRTAFIPFDEAFTLVLALVDTLSIPDR